MAPEVLRGSQADERSDLWSFGVVLYEMASGEHPFGGATAYQLTSTILEAAPKPLAPSLPEGLRRVIQRCLAKSPEQRFQRVGEAWAALEAVGASCHAGTAPSQAESPRPPSQNSGMRETIDSLAVLPFENAGQDPDTEYLSDGITQSIIYSISQIPQVRVAARSTVFRYKGRNVNPLDVGRELGVGAVLTGRLAQRGNLLDVGAELVDVRTGWQLWGHRYSRESSDLLALQEDIAGEIAEKLRLSLTREDQKRMSRRFTEDADAYQLYLKGRYNLNARTEDGLKKGLKLLHLAVQKDPHFALAHVGLTDANSWLGFFGILPPGEALPRAELAARKALEIDSSLAEAHAALGFLSFVYRREWQAAEQQLTRATELDAEYAPAHYWYAWYLASVERFPEALVQAEQAERLEPSAVLVITYVGLAFYLMRRYDEAIERFRNALERQPDFNLAHWWLGLALMEKGNYEEAITALEEALAQSGAHPSPHAALGQLYGRLGWTADEQAICGELVEASKQKYISAFDLAVCNSGRLERDAAFRWLEQAVEERSSFLVFSKVWPGFDTLRSDPRFANLVRRINFPR